MEFELRCKICGQTVSEEETLNHVATHPASAYFDVVPSIEWGFKQAKPKAKPKAVIQPIEEEAEEVAVGE